MTTAHRHLALVTLAAGGCVYLNAIYNAESLYEQAERARLEGLDSVAAVRYDSVVSKAARGFREDPSGGWADDALYLMGRAYLRRGEVDRARAALERALELADDADVRRGATLYLGAVATLEGDRTRALELLNRGLRDVPSDPVRAEGHLWRARANLAAGLVDAGWWDLDRVREADPRLSAAADLERVVWGVARGDSARARLGVARLLGTVPVHLPTDTLARLVEEADRRWGPEPAARLLAPVRDSPWPPDERDRLLLQRAELLAAAGDTAAARAAAGEVAAGFGARAVDARLFLARLLLASVSAVEELDGVRPILLPAAGAPTAREALEAIRTVELLHRAGTRGQDPVALFAAAETARDALGAPHLARRLFVGFADLAEGTPWAGKALLAALALPAAGADAAGGDDRLRARIRAMDANPYVRAARTGWFPAADFERLEGELRRALDRVLGRVDAQVSELEVRLRQRADTMR